MPLRTKVRGLTGTCFLDARSVPHTKVCGFQTLRHRKMLTKIIKIYKGMNLEFKNKGEIMGKCVYCKADVGDDRAVDVCTPCGHGIWGTKMFEAIISNMGSARDKGDLYQGSVTSVKQNF